MSVSSPTRPQHTDDPPHEDPMRSLYLAALNGDDGLARLVLAFLTVVSDPITDEN